MKTTIHMFLLLLMTSAANNAYSWIGPGDKSKSLTTEKSLSAGCLPPSTSAELNVNNVRALIHSGGDMWWDMNNNPRYEIPKGSGRHSLFVGTLWIGGKDKQTQTLKVAAQRYRNTGVDYWTGPLTTDGSASIDAETCDLYDQLWSVSREEVELFCLCNSATGTNQGDAACDGYTVPEGIKKWPGNPIIQANGQHLLMSHLLAPYADVDSSGDYDYTKGDYPFYDLDGHIDCKHDRSAYLYGDFTLWWVFNDKGNIHAESQGIPIGMEVRAQGFGFNTNDEINNMTFYNYQLINRGTTTLAECYFGVNTDADLGGGNDDYTGCDVQRGFGYMYNGDNFDENYQGELGYGNNPPAIGIDFFQGPYLDSNGIADYWDPNWNPINAPQTALDAISALTDTSRFSPAFGINGIGFDDDIIDNERFGMRRFVYYNNGSCSDNCDPTKAPDYYNFVRGYWKDGSRMVYGGDGRPNGQFANASHADFIFPGDSDPWNWGTKGTPQSFEWREQNTGTSPNTPGDRRFVQSAGPFTLKPGAINDITIGVVWARATTGDSYESVLKVLYADIKAQALFDNCFKVLEGPTAPDLNIQELDQQLVLFLTNKPSSNNYLNRYEEENYFIPQYGVSTNAITRDTIIEVPSYQLVTTPDSIWIYHDEITDAGNMIIPADTLLEVLIAGTPVDTLFGYYTNQSTEILTTIQIGSATDTTYYDRMIRFEGYLIYQLKSATVTASDIFGDNGTSVARLVAQCDIRNFDESGNPIGKLVNFEYDDELEYSVPKIKVNGANEGISHSFKLTEDQFATGDKKLVNHKTYYYMVIAYGYNNYKRYDPNDPNALDGQKEPFFPGRKNVKVYTAIPHIPAPEANGTVLNALYGTGPFITRIEGRGNGGNLVMLTDSTENAILQSPTHQVNELVYEKGMGPVRIKVIDPLSVKPGNFYLKIVDASTQTNNVVNTSAHWVLLDADTIPGADTVAYSDMDISQPYEQIIYDRRNGDFLGFSVTVSQTQNPGPVWTAANSAVTTSYLPVTTLEVNGTTITTPGNGLISSSMEYENPENPWLGFFQDLDGPTPLNWVRSGTVDDANDPIWNSNYFSVDPDNSPTTNNNIKVFIDPDQAFQNGISFYGGGGLVPYMLTSAVNTYQSVYPGHSLGSTTIVSISTSQTSINNATDAGNMIVRNINNLLGSIDIVFTPDRSKWTRCPVFEMQDNNQLSYVDPLYPGAIRPNKLDLRFSPSVDKYGQPADVTQGPDTDPESANYINPWGMSWFPGYVIDVETGERLNIGFGEDSYLTGENGNDMRFNPSQADPTKGTNEGWYSELGDYLFAGKHYLYIFGSNPQQLPYQSFPRYDAGKTIIDLSTDANGIPQNVSASKSRNIWRNCMWAGMPFHVKGAAWLGGEIRVRLRVNKNYQSGYAALNQSLTPLNDNNPMYFFSFNDLATQTNVHATSTSAMDLIQVVPNPYYAASDYETSPLDNKVKIVNLPEECTISIYTLSGSLVRRFVKGNTSTSLDWDLKNYKNIPIASGLYIIHIKADGIGERVLKWYGVMRPQQLDTF